MISNLRYAVHLRVPSSSDEAINGEVVIELDLKNSEPPLLIDFKQSPENTLSVKHGQSFIDHNTQNGHILIPGRVLEPGRQTLTIEFLVSQGDLNRRQEYMYSLFVPDKASLVFPCFDQPDLKARYRLTLDLPPGWKAVSNSPISRQSELHGLTRFEFQETQPISTYLFSFAAGHFKVRSLVRDGRVSSMYYRESDEEKVDRNAKDVFRLHTDALSWLEAYTEIPYPFEKFDFVLIPDFQFGGMEHPGAILYREASLLLDASATQNQHLNRARLIAHETAHMWFGDLVTMKWFDDVWTKEVFANFMAAKIVDPSYPNVNHELHFLLSHYPEAYEVERSPGTHPIRQHLENMNDAASLYGAIIYQKAPIVMRQLELMVGAEAFRAGIREYLTAFQFGNAGWPDLIDLLDRKSSEDLKVWSQTWVEGAGRPILSVETPLGVGDRSSSLLVRQSERPEVHSDPMQDKPRMWTQLLEIRVGWPRAVVSRMVLLKGSSVEVPDYWPSASRPTTRPSWVLMGGMGYGFFRLDPQTREFLLAKLPEIPDEIARANAWISLWEEMLHGVVPPGPLLDLLVRAIPRETDEQVTEFTLTLLDQLFWRFLPAKRRAASAPEIEEMLLNQLDTARSVSLKSSYFQAFRSVALSKGALQFLERVWGQAVEVPGLPLSETDYMQLSQELALREIESRESVLDAQLDRIENPERRDRFQFVRPALSAKRELRDQFFTSLKELKNRRQEQWVIEGLRYLHHPLRAASSVKYIRPGLDMLEEIQATGDIFFPKAWLDAILGGHQSEDAAEIVLEYLAETDLPGRLRGKVLQSADGLFRAARITQEKGGLNRENEAFFSSPAGGPGYRVAVQPRKVSLHVPRHSHSSQL